MVVKVAAPVAPRKPRRVRSLMSNLVMLDSPRKNTKSKKRNAREIRSQPIAGRLIPLSFVCFAFFGGSFWILAYTRRQTKMQASTIVDSRMEITRDSPHRPGYWRVVARQRRDFRAGARFRRITRAGCPTGADST